MSAHYRSINKSMISMIVVAMTLFFSACSEDSGGTYPPSTPPEQIPFTISGTIMEIDVNTSIEGAQVTIVNTETQQNESDPVYTDADGNYSVEVTSGGIYEVRVVAQNYLPSPPEGVAGIPIVDTKIFDVHLDPIGGGPYGLLSMQLVDYNESVGALVILTGQNTLENHSAVTNTTGGLMIYNLPFDEYNLTIRTIGHETYTSDSNVTIDSTDLLEVNYIQLTAIPGYTVSGTVTFLAVENSEVDVSLTDKITRKVIPGTNVNTVSRNFSMGSIAPGEYYIRATHKIDGYVVDPDSIVKHGEPEVTVVNVDMPLQDIDVTGAVTLISPIAESDGTSVEINTTTPTFSWVSYSSTTDYVVEVINSNGNVIWGGFKDDLTKKVLTTETSIEYNSDGAATQPLVDGKIYRWKVYASKNNVQSDTGWDLISSSEDAEGVFTVVLP